jgi:2-desacetyl-2-hydroxyethyl bacteriochlorophyllide A dehydrogenase
VGPRTAALAEPLAVAVHAIARSELRPGQVVALYGAGPVGLLTALVARHNGAGTVLVTDPNPWRRSVAEALGLSVVPEGMSMAEALRPFTGGQGADLTIDAAAHPAVAAELSGVTRVHGRITVVGVYERPANPDLRALCFKEQTMIGVRVYTTEDVSAAVDLIASAAIDLTAFPTTAFDLADAEAAFRAAAGGQGCLKALLTPVEGMSDR